jgi:hypothetical protein
VTARTSSSARTQHAGLWSHLTAASTRSSRGERKRCSALCAASRSPYLLIGSSQLTCWTSPATAAPLLTLRSTRHQHLHQRPHHRHLLLPRLHALAATLASPHAYPPKNLRGGAVGTRPQDHLRGRLHPAQPDTQRPLSGPQQDGPVANQSEARNGPFQGRTSPAATQSEGRL